MKKSLTPGAGRAAAVAEVLPLYTVPQLAALAKTSRFRMARLLETHRVEVVRSGRSVLVPLSELEEKVPLLLDAIEAAARAQKRVDSK